MKTSWFELLAALALASSGVVLKGDTTDARANAVPSKTESAPSGSAQTVTENTPPRHWEPDPVQRENLRRSLTLLGGSTPTERRNVRILFYGQSITEQAWSKDVEKHLRTTYPNAHLTIANRAIGGHSSQLLVKTAESDLYLYQPDLVIFHVYGSHTDYETIIRRIRERTCADILLQTDHITNDQALTEPTDPAQLTPKQWDAWMNNAFLPGVAAKYNACRADIHPLWKEYLKDNHLKAADLLKDGVHLNKRGEWLMAELIKPYLAPLPPNEGYDPNNELRVQTAAVSAGAGEPVTARFTGTRVDLVFKTDIAGEISVKIDGQTPSSIPELYGFTRVSAFPNSNWPILLKVGSSAPLQEEQWSMRITDVSEDGKVCHFQLRGSLVGEDGEGVSTNRFVSKSGRIVIEPQDWNLAYCLQVFKRPLPADHTVTWKSVLLGVDSLRPPPAFEGAEVTVSVAHRLKPGQHTIELTGPHLGQQLKSLRCYNPPLAKPDE